MELNSMQVALNSVKTLKCELMELFIGIHEGVKDDGSQTTDSKNNHYLHSMNELIGKIGLRMRDLEQVVGNLSSPPGAMSLYNTSFLAQESTSDGQALYIPLVSSHKWLDKVHKFSSNAVQILSQNSLKKSFYNSSSNKKQRQQSSLHNISPQAVDVLLTNINRMFPEMSITITRRSASNVILLVGLGRILQAVISFKGLMIEMVSVKGFDEPIDPNNLQQEFWKESRYQVFRDITDHANLAAANFYSPTLPDFSVRSFMTWLNSFLTLFSDVCKRCGKIVRKGYIATWRDLRSLETFHHECFLM